MADVSTHNTNREAEAIHTLEVKAVNTTLDYAKQQKRNKKA